MLVNGLRGAREDGFTNDAEGYALPDETQSHFQTECTSYRNVSEFCAPRECVKLTTAYQNVDLIGWSPPFRSTMWRFCAVVKGRPRPENICAQGIAGT